ncbi:hypothetical protein [Streptomyces sp. 1222.5]|uniref:hypothetical protein n=1 Tax=Streptomyces sp. 1222.5 TaxID=1881026 RepID=UPI003D734D5B
MTSLSEEDIAAAREQGDLAALILMSSGLTIKAPKQRAAPAEPSPLRARPGAWPSGTRSPGCTQEVAEYLAHLWPGVFSPAEPRCPQLTQEDNHDGS